jgi:hypothetical protein
MTMRLFALMVVLLLFAAVETHAELQFSHIHISALTGPDQWSDGTSPSFTARLQFGLNDTNNLASDGLFQLFHAQFLHTDNYRSSEQHGYGMTGALAGFSLDITGMIPQGKVALMPTLQGGAFRFRRDAYNESETRLPYSFGSNYKDAYGTVGAIFGGFRMQGALIEAFTFRVEALAGMLGVSARLLDVGVDIPFHRGFAFSVEGQICAIDYENNVNYTTTSDTDSGVSVFQGTGAQGWRFVFVGLTYQF